MTTYIGRIGDMVPIGCLSAAPMTPASRIVYGGGPGTLAPLRARVNGRGPRQWRATKGVSDFGAMAALSSLVETQQEWGGAYRVVLCDAVEHNMLTPQASNLVGWANVSRGWRASFPEVEGAWADSVIPLTIPFIIGGTGGVMAAGNRPSSLGKIAAGQTATSPLIPVIRPDSEAFASVYLAGTGTLRVRAYNGAGAATTYSRAFSGVVGVLQRTTLPHTPDDSRVSVRIEVVATSEVLMAWPSYAHRDTPYSPGRGVDQAVIEPVSHDVIGTWDDGLQSTAFTIQEVCA